MTPGLFIAGTGTEVGKTYVAALIVRQLVAEGRCVGVYKPVASGCRQSETGIVSDDAVALWRAAGSPETLDQVCPQRFVAPVAPPQAAREEGRQVDEQHLHAGLDAWRRRSEVVVVEGAGGLMSPVSDAWYSADLAVACGYPLVVVAPNVLGTINGTLQTLITARTFAPPLAVVAVVVNDVGGGQRDRSAESNRMEIARRCQLSTVTAVAWNGQAFDRRVDWFGLAQGHVAYDAARGGSDPDGPQS